MHKQFGYLFLQLKTFITTQLVMSWPVIEGEIEVGIFPYAENAFSQLTDFDAYDVNDLVMVLNTSVFRMASRGPRISRLVF